MRRRYARNLLCSLAMVFCLSVSSGQAGELATSTIDAQVRITGAVEQPLTFHAPDLATLPRQTLRVRDHQGRESVFEGGGTRRVAATGGCAARKRPARRSNGDLCCGRSSGWLPGGVCVAGNRPGLQRSPDPPGGPSRSAAAVSRGRPVATHRSW
jgi:hypothetical protein